VIILDQIPKILGIHFAKGSFGPDRLFFNLEMAVDRYRATVAADSSQI
jgi:hypothetical protein